MARKHHLAVCRFLKRAEIYASVKKRLGDNSEFVLFEKMCKSKLPLKGSILEYDIGVKSTVSGAAQRLNIFLRDFSYQFQVLKDEEVFLTIPRKKGSVQVGYYFVCFDTFSDQYLDPENTKKLLEKTWQKWKQEKIPKKRVRKKRPSQQPQFRYLRNIEQVLRIGTSEKPKWFRKTGPIAADFDDGRVYRREKTLDDLKKLVMNNSVSMLEGVGATGKTVLVLNLAYDLYKAGKNQVFYFDCDKDRDFDRHELIR